MAQRQKNRLVPVTVNRLKEPGMFADGAGLYLRVGPNGSKSWVFRYKNGKKEDGKVKRHELGLGPFPAITLAEARELAAAARKQRAHGIDPLELKRSKGQAAKLAAARSKTFAECARSYILENSPGWRSAQHAREWAATLEQHVYPFFGSLPVASIDTNLVTTALRAIWQKTPETGSRVRGRIEKILDFARVSGFRTGENPARWKGHLDQIFKSRAKLAKGEHLPAKVRHHAALPHAEIAAFMTDLRQLEGIAALALEFVILTAARTGEVIGATWSEIDLDAGIWTIPAERMKAGQAHRVPLSKAAVRVLEQARNVSTGEHIFPGPKMAMLQLLQRTMGRTDVTCHGFRTTFRVWAAEQTSSAYEVMESAISHAAKSKVEAAYARTDYLELRRKLMEAWAAYCEGDSAGNVISLKRAG